MSEVIHREDFYTTVYERVNEILNKGIRSNGFQRPLEAISFVSALFALIMDQEGLNKILSLCNGVSTQDDFTEWLDWLQKKTTKYSTNSLGVSKQFAKRYFNDEFSYLCEEYTTRYSKISHEGVFISGEKLKLMYDLLEELLIRAKSIQYSGSIISANNIMYVVAIASVCAVIYTWALLSASN